MQTESKLRIRLVECGPETPTERTVFCVHGWGCSTFSFRLIALALAERNVKTISIDLPGHGLSDKPDDERFYTTDALAQTVAEVCDAIGLGRAIFTGHSMGTAVSARLAVLRPDLAQGLVLVAPIGFVVSGPMRAAILATPALLTPLLAQFASRSVVKMILERAFGNPDLLPESTIDEYWAPTQFPSFTRSVRTLLHTFDWHAAKNLDFNTIHVPTTIVYSTKDNLVPESAALQYKSVVPTAEFICLDGIGHAITDESPAPVVEAILKMSADLEEIS